MTRLYKDHRITIANACVKDKFDKKQEELKEQKLKAFIDLYSSVVSTAETHAYRNIKNLSMNFNLKYADGFTFTVNGELYYQYIDTAKYQLIPLKDMHFNGRENIEALALQKICHEIENTKVEREKLKATLIAKLSAISTFKKLYELWPEGEVFYKNLAGAAVAKSTSTALCSFDHINQTLGLPKESGS